MIEQLYLYLILIGVTIGAVLLALYYQARSANHANLALIQLNEQEHFDTLSFLNKAWPLLEQAGLQGMTWRLDWFGAILEGQAGKQQGHTSQREISIAEMHLRIELFQNKRRGERRYFETALIETFFLLLRSDMLIKANATAATFAQMSQLNLFLQHDMKNIAQFVQLMADQVATLPGSKEQKFLEYLRLAAPLARQRADHIVHTLTAGESRNAGAAAEQTSSAAASAHDLSTPHQPDGTHLQEMLAQLCHLHQLEYSITGTAQVSTPHHALDRALDNILKNYSDLQQADPSVRPSLKIEITPTAAKVAITISAANLPSSQLLERLFEPFWSNKPDGLGIGLYQAKQTLEEHGGALNAIYGEQYQLQFQLTLPALAPSV